MERKTYIDIAKGIAMLLVVMQHIGGTMDLGISVLCKADVPIFFLCSGYLAMKSKIDIPLQFKKILLRIAVPFIFAVCAAALFFNENLIDIFTSYGKRGYWFLEALFFMYLLFWPIYKSDKLLITGGIVVEFLLLLASKYSPETIDGIFGFSYLSRYFPCFIAGAFLRRHNFNELNNRWLGILVVAVPLFCFLWKAPSTNVSFLIHIIGYLGAALIGFWTIVQFETRIPLSVRNQLSYIGRYSLNVYIIHFFIVPFIGYLTPWFIVDFFVVLLLAVIVTYASIAIGKFLTFATPLNRVLTP